MLNELNFLSRERSTNISEWSTSIPFHNNYKVLFSLLKTVISTEVKDVTQKLGHYSWVPPNTMPGQIYGPSQFLQAAIHACSDQDAWSLVFGTV